VSEVRALTLSGSATSMTTAAEALHAEEIERTRGFLELGWLVAVAVIALVLVVPGNRRLAMVLIATIGVGLLVSIWIHRQLRDPARFDAHKLTALALICVICGQLGLLYVGLFSGAPLITVLGLYFFCRTESLGAATAILVLASGAHAVEAALIFAGVIDDPGFYLVRPGVTLAAKIAGALVLQGGYVTAFVMARHGRTASVEAIEQLREATRLAAQREEQVQELRQDLDRALEIGGPGRFTGHTIGEWELGFVLGRGAMGEVYEGTHRATGDAAAVKLLRRELLGASHFVERFLREVRIASALDSPHVVRVLGASTPEDPLPFLAMERLHGQSLGDLLRARRTLSQPALRTLVSQLASVLEKARAASIVHRDIKPHNVYLADVDGGDSVWKLLDFGVAHLGESTGTLTQGMVVGTPGYMAPEQAKGEAVDHRADVYALAALIYRCVTGQVPFTGRDSASVLYAVVHQMPQRPGAIAVVAPQVEAMLAIGLAKSANARFQTAAELAVAFEDADRGELSEPLRSRARALLRQHPWAEPSADRTRPRPLSVRG
jgi:serine/threonine-protein kinase